MSPGSWAAARPPATLGEPPGLAAAVEAQLSGVALQESPLHLTVVVAENEANTFSGVGSGSTVLLFVPATIPWTVGDAARLVVTAVARGRSAMVPPDHRCSEPLLALAEALATAGSFQLATLPPALRPVADWLEADDAVPPLAAFIDAALDAKEPWATRRVRLQQTTLTSGANAGLLNAAALLVETYGDIARARREPYDLLLAWREKRYDALPPPPAGLRRALAAPQSAGMPRKELGDDSALIARDVLERAVASGRLDAVPKLDGAPLRLRALAAARARAQGSPAVCRWLLAGPVPDGIRTGCRSDESPSGYVASRPHPRGGFELFATAGAEEVVLLHWPRWLLHPLYDGALAALVFADAEGVWRVSIDGSSPPTLIAAGAFRHLARSPDGRRIAAARWPEGSLVLLAPSTGVREIDADARGGAAWLDDDLVVAAGRERAVVASAAGEVRPLPLELPCASSVARFGAALLLGSAAPCEVGLAWVPLGEGDRRLVLRRTESPLGIVPVDGSVALFGDVDGVFRWSGGDTAARIGGGLTPGPG